MELDDAKLDDMIKQCKDAPAKTPQRLYKWLIELKQRRESALRPADKYLTNTPEEQYDHMVSEYDEIQREMYPSDLNRNISRLTEELVDLQRSCETMLTVLGLDEQARMKERRKIIAKNDERDYYRKVGEESKCPVCNGKGFYYVGGECGSFKYPINCTHCNAKRSIRGD